MSSKMRDTLIIAVIILVIVFLALTWPELEELYNEKGAFYQFFHPIIGD